MPQDALSKDTLRKELRAKREGIDKSEAAKLSQRIVRNCLGQLPLAGHEVVALYWPVGNEVDARALAGSEVLSDTGFCLPVIDVKDGPLSFHSWKPGDPVQRGAFGPKVPVAGAPVTPDLVLTPLLGFDREGFRLGQGGGYYDRTLQKLRSEGQVLAVGLAFSFQECFKLPRNDHDERLDCVVTEDEVIIF